MQGFIKISLIALLLMFLGFSSHVHALVSNFYHWVYGGFRYISYVSVPDNAWTDRYFGSWLQPAPTKFFPNANCPFVLGWVQGNLRISERGGTMPGPDKIPLNMIPFGIAVDGVLFDPSGPWYSHTQALYGNPPIPPIVTPPLHPTQAAVKGFNANNVTDDDCSGWEYEALSTLGRPNLGFDIYSGHIQPLVKPPNQGTPGRYHYHGYPFALVEKLITSQPGKPTYLLGYSADGFPIYTPWNGTKRFVSGYILSPGARGNKTGTGKYPDGFYDGTFVQDYDYNPTAKRQLVLNEVRARGHYFGLVYPVDITNNNLVVLDHRNGIWGPTPEYPNGTYYYVITADWPYIPRWFATWPDDTFKQLIPPERNYLYKCGSLHKYNGITY